MEEIKFEEFKSLFNFQPEKKLAIGMERESFLTDYNDEILPLAPKVLNFLWENTNGRKQCYGYELSACQLEEKINLTYSLVEVEEELIKNDKEIKEAERYLRFKRKFIPVGPENMPLDVYPDKRYLKIVKNMNPQTLKAACRVTGIHIHIGMPDHETALLVYNEVIKKFEYLCIIGCIDNSQRLDIYHKVINKSGNQPSKEYRISKRLELFRNYLIEIFEPPTYESWKDFYNRAKKEKFVNDPRRLWDFVRISPKGSIEFRMFDTTENKELIFYWLETCYNLCQEILS